MTGLGEQILQLARQSVEDPRAGMRAVLQQGVPVPARTAGLLLMAVASALLMHLGSVFLPPPVDPLTQFMMHSPIRTAVIQWLILAGSVLLIHRIGRAWGGRGNFADTLLTVVWLQVILLGVQMLQIVALALLPPFAPIVNIGGLVLFFWLISGFVAELHGFASRWAVLAGILVTSIAVAVVVVAILTMIVGQGALQGV